ncbi:MAG: type I-C CRISPR-associated protein Cas5c [Terracidiphilus sp.]|nr:type I-C CRISPR-associated protein Cas5c [Terracidiphilus sp.]
MNASNLLVRVEGLLACFTRPEFSTERVSYEVMTPSAARAILEAILWKPAIRWRIHAIHVLNPIRWMEFRRNEVNSRASTSGAASAAAGRTEFSDFFADADRAQRHTVALRDVDYLVEASFELTGRAGPADNMGKFFGMFERRLGAGQQIYQPYLGCREFPAFVAPVDADHLPQPIAETRDLGWMLHDMEYGAERRPRFFKAQLEAGVVQVPAWEEAVTA